MTSTPPPNVSRVGMIGLGSIAAKVYLPELCGRDDVDVVGIASRRFTTSQYYGQLYRIPGQFVSLEDVLRERPSIVFVHASTTAHYDIVLRCLEAGISVFVDKPLTDDVHKTRHLVQVAADRGLLLAVGFNRRFAPMITRARKVVDQPEFISVEKHRPSVQDAPARVTVYDDLIHPIDTAMWLLGKGAELTECQLRTDKTGRLLTATGTLKSADAVAHFAMCRQAGSDHERISLHGAGKSTEVTDLEYLTVHTAQTSRTETIRFGSWDTIQYRRGFTDLITQVLTHVDRPADCAVSAYRTLATHEMVESVLTWPRG